ncbi:MAG: sulfatase-like hydrolase/transferase [Beijerinckiaceae bacterium]
MFPFTIRCATALKALATVLVLSAGAADAQVFQGVPGAPDTREFPASRVLPVPTAPFSGDIQPNLVDSKPGWPSTLAPPKGAPNVLLVLIDDAGFGSNSAFGGIVPTPTLDQLAQRGIRYTQMHNTALCSPTRAALLTGRNHHAVAFGNVAEGSSGYPGYDTVTGPESAHMAMTLRQNGYATSWFGKNHNVPVWEATPTGPFTNFPIGQGYDYFYGFIGGDTSQWEPGNLFRNTTPIHPYNGKQGQWNLVTAMADDAIEYIRTQTATNPNRPWFMHYAPGATHAPHHPTKEWVDKISDMKLFDEGWNKVAEKIFANQKRLGVIPANSILPPWPDGLLPRWESLNADQKRLYLRQINVWAAYMAYVDAEIGRVIDSIEKLGQLDNTLIIWVAGDNGMSAEGSLNGTPNEVAYFNGATFTVEQMLPLIPMWGTDRTYNHFAVPWAFAMDTPYRWVKQVASHLGGTRTGMVISWPSRIKDVGTIRHQFHHVIDVAPTVLEAIGIPQPTFINGIQQRPYDGVSMTYTWDPANAKAPSTRRTQYFEIFGNRAIYHDGWMANTTPVVTPWEGVAGKPPVDVMNGYVWELYNLVEDPTQTNDLAAKEPERLRMMQELWTIEATRNNVFPLNNSQVPIITNERPGPAAGRTQFVYTTPMASTQFAAAPSILNRSFKITAEFEVPQGGANGVLVTQGGRFAGYGLYLKDGKPTFTYNALGVERFKWQAAEPLAPGKHTVVFEWKMDPQGMAVARGGSGTLSVDGRSVAQRSLPKTIPFIWAWDETFDVGLDTGTSVDDSDYQVPFAFTGKFGKVVFDLGESSVSPASIKAMMEELAKKRDR